MRSRSMEGNDEGMEAAQPLHRQTYTGKLLTVSEVSKILKVSEASVRKWIREAKIPAIRTPGGTYRIFGREVDEILKEYQPDDD